MNDKWDFRFLEMAQLVATWSKDPSTQVGAVITRNKKIISLGFNGFPEKMNDHEYLYSDREEKYSRVIHAEMNALLQTKTDVTGCTLYTYPIMSCDRCFVHMVQAGITRYVYPTTPLDKITRWGPIFDKVRKYAAECKVELVEIDYHLENIMVKM